MSTCGICRRNYNHGGPCSECEKLYKQCVAEGRTPPQFTREKVPFKFNDWYDITLASMDASRKPGATKHTIKAAADSEISRCVRAHLIEAGRVSKASSNNSSDNVLDIFPY